MLWPASMMLSALPTTLLALVFALPVFSEPTSELASPNDAFRAISLRVKKQPTEPICCLKPLAPSEPVDDGILLSFEEWKNRQLAVDSDPAQSNVKDTNGRGSTGPGLDKDMGGVANESEATIPPSDSADPMASASQAQPSPEWDEFSYSKVPTTDRFNYASLDCSARVHIAHRSAKSPSSILSSKRDRYMLSPCGTEDQFVVVELCDDIRIDTVQLANFEFFSGVFKDFTVSVAKTYTMDPDAWTHVRAYRAKNVRGVQTFHPPRTLRDFYRFIRIDFRSHYGNEYYCPVSLLRVYGLTHLEEWKLEIWESESRAKQELQKKKQLPAPPDATPVTPLPSSTAHPTNISEESQSPDQRTGNTTVNLAIPDHTSSTEISGTQSSSVSPTFSKPQSAITSISSSSSIITSKNERPTHVGVISSQPLTFTATAQDQHSTLTSSTQGNAHIPSPSASQDYEPSTPLPESSTFVNTAAVNATTSPTIHAPPNHSQRVLDTPTIIVSSPSVSVIPIAPVPPTAKGGESIYRTILNRLSEVEMNQTLYMRYIEQQNLAIRDVIKRLGEDVGRLEGITRAQSVTYQRTLNAWEKQRYQLEMEYGDLLSRIELLSEEIVLEKRLGVAQLCLLLAVLVFLGLTRGSRAEALIDHGSTQLNRSVREWGKRHFKISGDWRGRFKGRNLDIPSRRSTPSHSRDSNRTHTPSGLLSPKHASGRTHPTPLSLHQRNDENMIAFPSSSKLPLETINLNTSSVTGDYFDRPRTRTISNPRSRAPSLRTPGGRRTQHFQKVTTPFSSNFRPQNLQRSNSHGMPSILQSGSWGSINVPKSAKKWARTAHLHEVKNFGRPTSAGVRRATDHDRDVVKTSKEFAFERAREDIFSLPSLSTSAAKSLSGEVPQATSSPKLESSLLMKPESSLEDGDAWVDTDSVDGSELDAEQLLSLSPQDTRLRPPIS